jgi:hypothetical protein
MKKIILLSCFAIAAIFLSSFEKNEESTEGDKGVSNTEMWEYMRENVFNELNELVSYEEEKLFSRCPSGFSQYINDTESTDAIVYGNIMFAEGCSRQDFCEYKVDWKKKETFLRKTNTDSYLSVSSFVSAEKKKIAKI